MPTARLGSRRRRTQLSFSEEISTILEQLVTAVVVHDGDNMTTQKAVDSSSSS